MQACPSAAPAPCRAGFRMPRPFTSRRPKTRSLEDVDGNRYLDFAGGIGCLNVGHRARAGCSRPSRDQLDQFLHTCVQVTPYEGYVRLAERLNQITPGKFSEENAVREYRRRSRRERGQDRARSHRTPGIIAFEDAFHGRTMMALALTSKTHPYKAGFAAFSRRRVSHSVSRIAIAAPTR